MDGRITRAIIPERYGRGIVHALVVSNMLPDAAHPERGRFVRDQVDALGRLDGVDVELYEFPPGPRALARAARALRRRYAGERFDVVHAHYGLSAWPALAVHARVRALTVHGTDVSHPRTRLLTRAVIGRMDILAAASAPLAERVPGGHGGRGGGGGRGGRGRRRIDRGATGPPGDGRARVVQVLPCGVDLDRFRPIPRAQALARLGLDAGQPQFVLFAADPSRAEKRCDRARELARAAGAQLRTLSGVTPELVPCWINAANAVLVPSEREGFGLAVLEALACDVPVLATPVGVHPEALHGVEGALCAPFALGAWLAALEPHLREADPRIAGRAHAEPFSATRMAERVADAWRAALRGAG
jgi:teichuronic acid biosynthesis glycosyltransferase TuaC